MQTEVIQKPEIKLVGLSIRTNNRNEMDPHTAKIGETMGRFLGQNLAAQIQKRKNTGTLFSVYTEYESDVSGDYTYFVGEEVSDFESVPTGLEKLCIPSATYQKFTTSSGKMPDVVINAWQKIWKMTSSDFAGKRSYQADFELYDERAKDPAKTSLDIFIGIEA